MSDGYINGNPSVSWWLTQINAGIEYRKKVAYQDNWDMWRNFYRGSYEGHNELPSHLIFKMLRVTVPRVYFRDPAISITPTKPGLEQALFAQLLQRIDNKLIRRMGLKTNMKRMTHNAFMFGTGVGKLGFGAMFTPTPDFGSTEAPIGKKNQRVEYSSGIAANLPWFRSVHPSNFIVPAESDFFEDVPWEAQYVVRPLDDVKSDTRLKHVKGLSNRSKKSKSNYSFVSDGMYLNKSRTFRQPTEMVEMFEIRDKRTGKVFIIAPYVSDRILFFDDDAFQFENNTPFFKMVFNEDDEYCWGVPDAKLLEVDQREINETRRLIMLHRRLSLVKILAKKGALSEKAIASLLNADVKGVVEVDGDILSDMKILDGNHIPEDLIRHIDVIMNNARESMGFSRNQMSEFNRRSGDTTATEAKIVQASSDLRVDERRDISADILVQVVRHMHEIIFNNWTGDMVEKVMGPLGVPIWIKFRPHMLKGAYEVKVDPDNMTPQTREVRSANAMFLYEKLAQDPMINGTRLRQHLVRELGNVEYEDLFLFDTGNPGQSASNPIELQDAASEIAKQMQSRRAA